VRRVEEKKSEKNNRKEFFDREKRKKKPQTDYKMKAVSESEDKLSDKEHFECGKMMEKHL
jgi:hypothetical protein